MGAPLPPDSPDSFKADLMAMRHDAREWMSAAERIAQAATVARQVTLNEYEFSLLAREAGLINSYRILQEWTAGLLEGAYQNLANMAFALMTAADTYEATDGRTAKAFDQLSTEITKRTP